MMLQFETNEGDRVILPISATTFAESSKTGFVYATTPTDSFMVRATLDQISDALCHGGPFRDLSK